jgi:isocitrate dehydrogenase
MVRPPPPGAPGPRAARRAMTKDLAILIDKNAPFQTTQDFLSKLDETLQKKMK